MEVRELAVPGAVVFTPRVHPDPRGEFLEWYRADVLEAAVGHQLTLAQANHSVSRLGTLRGVHYADVPPGQAKYVYCPQGSVLDVVVDLRVGSPAFGSFDTVTLDAEDRRAVYLPEGVGHAFMALTDGAAVTYLCSTGYAPDRERTVCPLDPTLALPWPADLEALLSDKDRAAPTLQQAQEQGLLPQWSACSARYAALAAAEPAVR